MFQNILKISSHFIHEMGNIFLVQSVQWTTFYPFYKLRANSLLEWRSNICIFYFGTVGDGDIFSTYSESALASIHHRCIVSDFLVRDRGSNSCHTYITRVLSIVFFYSEVKNDSLCIKTKVDISSYSIYVI